MRSDIKHRLSEHLPDYMVPAQLIFLDQLPLSPNGKLDRKALPKPDANLLQKAYVAPQSPLEQQIAAIWQDVLKLERVGLNDNFFELGGDSIISIQVVSRARQQGIAFTPKELFQHQTVQGLASVAAYRRKCPGDRPGTSHRPAHVAADSPGVLKRRSLSAITGTSRYCSNLRNRWWPRHCNRRCTR